MANIERIPKLKRESLSSEHYLASLLEQGYIAQLLSDTELERLQADCLALLAQKSERYTAGGSSSIPVERAQALLASILFTLGVALKTYPNPEDALSALQADGIEATYIQGRQQIDTLLKRAKIRHAALVERLFPTENDFYASTLVAGIQGFFKLYNPEYAAQEIHITADYPVYNPMDRLLGIEFIAQYLEQLYCENAFCLLFPAEDIAHLLYGYDAHYQGLLFNLYEPILAASLGRILAGHSAGQLEITPSIQAVLSQQFHGKHRAEIEPMLAAALSQLALPLSFSKRLQRYLHESLPTLAATIENGAATNTLDRIFLLPQQAPHSVRISYGEPMDNALYRKFLEAFLSASMADKIHMMHAQIHSLTDLNDLLLDVEPNPDDLLLLLQALHPAELAALLKKYDTSYALSLNELRDSEQALWKGLQRLTASLSPIEQAALQNAVQHLEEAP